MGTLSDSERDLLRWRSRRGLLENDLIISKFLDQYESSLTQDDARNLMTLFELDDNTLLQVLLGTEVLESPYDSPEIQRLVKLMQS
ncbi:conserved hypothetical protein [Taylorella asinigenitalis 14/45]|uniref:FAD assembly factor SdhE n=1 Tax=Taylorella asinigenitalis 14/45 TaxID=1091495 RepID=I7IKI4_9BURK|nr:succinate dehydrogenase assembly factor 2 [Taylorella asinigenitalis]CCG19232.1 conserved hypothetical protein [Taylorella asinigenitalis 14/45]